MEYKDDPDWQDVRKALKGLSTEEKLHFLDGWRQPLTRAKEVQIDNYINALLRGGQLVRGEGGKIRVQR